VFEGIPYHVTEPADREITYTYNKLGQKTNVTLIDDSSTVLDVDYLYYANGWLKKVESGTTDFATYTYDPVGIRTRVDHDNTTFTTHAYDSDPRYRTSSISHYRTGDPDVELEEIIYSERDGAGNPLEMEDASGTTEYTYDMNSRLDEATYPVQGYVNYNYDWVGNRDDPNALAFNNADQLTSWPGQHTYDYYGTGSLHRQYNSQAVLQKTYAYTGANLLASVTHAGVTNPSLNEWDADGNRIKFTRSTGGAYTFVYDTTAGIPAVIEEETPTSTVYYIREPDGSLIARVEGSVVQYYHFDDLGSTKLLTSAAGVVTDTYSYDAWGQVTHTGPTEQPYQYVGRLGYHTHYQDANLALLQLGVRFYDSEIGRFGQRDLLNYEGWNAFVYGIATPTSRVDPTGMKDEDTTTLPTLVKDRSCDCLGYGPLIDAMIRAANRHLKRLITEFSLEKCPATVVVKCKEDCGTEVCGFAIPYTGKMTINLAPQCSSAKCLILHELFHACGVPGHLWKGQIRIPGCGENTGFKVG